MATPTIQLINIIPLFPRGNFIEWQWVTRNPPTTQWEFAIERSESPNGPFTRVSDPYVVDNISFFDRIPTHFMGRAWYYRVLLRGGTENDISVAATYLTNGNTLPTRIQGEISKLRYNLSVLLYADSGSEIMVFKRKNFGTPCPVCRSNVLNVSTNSQCSTCFGTKIVGGFYPPTITRALYTDPPLQENMDDEGESEFRVFTLKTLDIPNLSVDDLILETRTGQLYEVKTISTTRRYRVIVHQEPTVSELPKSHPFHLKINNVEATRYGNEIEIFESAFKRF